VLCSVFPGSEIGQWCWIGEKRVRGWRIRFEPWWSSMVGLLPRICSKRGEQRGSGRVGMEVMGTAGPAGVKN